MGEKQLREKYGGKLAKAINRAIRAELPDGNAALDKLTTLSGPASQAMDFAHGTKAIPAVQAFEKQKRLVAGLEAQIRNKWGIAPALPEKSAAKSRPRPRVKPGMRSAAKSGVKPGAKAGKKPGATRPQGSADRPTARPR